MNAHLENQKKLKFLGKRIKEIRISKGMSQEYLADITGIHRTYVGMLERGEKNATIFSLEKISKSLEVPLSELLKDFENGK